MDLFVIDTLGSKDLIKSKRNSSTQGSYFGGEGRESTRKPLEEPEEEYDEDFGGKFSFLP